MAAPVGGSQPSGQTLPWSDLTELSHGTPIQVIAREPFIATSRPASRSNNNSFCPSSDGRRLAPCDHDTLRGRRTPWQRDDRFRRPRPWLPGDPVNSVSSGLGQDPSRHFGRRCRAGWCLTGRRHPCHTPIGRDRDRSQDRQSLCCDCLGRTVPREVVRGPLSQRPRCVVRAAAGHLLRHGV